MSHSSSLLYINFKPAADAESQHKSPSLPKLPVNPFSGDDAKDFYESIVSDPPAEETNLGDDCEAVFKRALETEQRAKRKKSKSKRKTQVSIQKPLAASDLFQACQNGDAASVRSLLGAGDPGVDVRRAVTARDAFGWTPLMSASCAGNAAVADLLLQCEERIVEVEHAGGNGDDDDGATSDARFVTEPWWCVTDRRGRSARDLAAAAGHDPVVELLDAHRASVECDADDLDDDDVTDGNDGRRHAPGRCRGSRAAERGEESRPLASEAVRCDLCRLEFSSRRRHAAHLASTVHRLNAHEHGGDAPPTRYAVPSHNAGYRLLLRDGWNPERGLGTREDGRKLPVSTSLKRSRAGLGCRVGPREERRKRITHFSANDETSVQCRRDGRPEPVKMRTTKREMLRHVERMKRKERHLRRELSATPM